MANKLDILNCAASGKVEFRFVCPNTWEQMQTTDSDNKRFCTQCQRNVFKCHNANEAALRANQDECIAVPDWLAHEARQDERPERVLIVGQPTPLRKRLANIVQKRLDEGSKTDS